MHKRIPEKRDVSVALSLAAGRDAEVELWADPAVERNIHEIFLKAEFGDIYLKVNNVQSPDNPATSYLAALSILTLLKNLKIRLWWVHEPESHIIALTSVKMQNSGAQLPDAGIQDAADIVGDSLELAHGC